MAAPTRGFTLCRSAALAEIDEALKSVKSAQDERSGCAPRGFAIPTLDAADAVDQEELGKRSRLHIAARHPSSRYSVSDCERSSGIGTPLGDAGRRTRKASCSRTRIRVWSSAPKNVRGYQTRSRLFFHNDNGRRGWPFCIQSAKVGRARASSSALRRSTTRYWNTSEYIDELCRAITTTCRREPYRLARSGRSTACLS